MVQLSFHRPHLDLLSPTKAHFFCFREDGQVLPIFPRTTPHRPEACYYTDSSSSPSQDKIIDTIFPPDDIYPLEYQTPFSYKWRTSECPLKSPSYLKAPLSKGRRAFSKLSCSSSPFIFLKGSARNTLRPLTSGLSEGFEEKRMARPRSQVCLFLSPFGPWA